MDKKINFLKKNPLLWGPILALASMDLALFLWFGYPTKISIFIGVFLNLLTIFIVVLFNFTKKKDQSDEIENFLDIPKGSIKYSHIMSFLSDQVFGTFLTAITLIYGRKIFQITDSAFLSATFTLILFILTITIITFSLSRITIQLFRSNISDLFQWIIIIILLIISWCFYMSGLELAPKITPKIQQSFLEK